MDSRFSVSVTEFKRMLDTNEVRFLFDMRNEKEFEAWRIEGHIPIETLNIPQVMFVGEEEKYLDRFPKNRRITIICPHGDAAKYAAEQLRENGIDAVAVEGGLDAWSEFYEDDKVNDTPAVYQIFRAARGCISYLVVSGNEAVAIDVTRHFDHVLALSERLGVKIKYVLDTHLHADHVSGGRELAEKTGASYYIHPGDMGGATIDYLPLTDGQQLRFGSNTIEAIHTPGHTPGSTSFYLDKRSLFTGDIIMKRSIGRPDLGGKAEEWAVQLHDTLFDRLAKLPDDTIVLPSHAASLSEQDARNTIKTTLGEARREKDLYQIRDIRPFINFVNSSLPVNPERYQEIRKVNLGLKKPDEATLKELEIGKNLCGMVK
jgi:glyoxylase-like metal-dependent hydrolase (beta-lactamase superfamily II)